MIDDKKYIKRKEIAGLGVLTLLLIGAVMCLFFAIQIGGYGNITRDKYLTDPTIPYNEYDNATYTISLKEIREIVNDQLWYLGAGISLIGMAYVGLIVISAVTPTQKERHLDNCEYTIKTEQEITHCPTCGLKLSLLDKK